MLRPWSSGNAQIPLLSFQLGSKRRPVFSLMAFSASTKHSPRPPRSKKGPTPWKEVTGSFFLCFSTSCALMSRLLPKPDPHRSTQMLSSWEKSDQCAEAKRKITKLPKLQSSTSWYCWHILSLRLSLLPPSFVGPASTSSFPGRSNELHPQLLMKVNLCKPSFWISMRCPKSWAPPEFDWPG